MKKLAKSLGILTLAVLMALAATACGGAMDMKKIAGTWSLSTINGQDYTAYCEAQGIDPDANNTIWDIGETSITAYAAGITQELKITPKSNGFELLNTDGSIFVSVTYDESKKTLSYKLTDGTNTSEMVLAPYTGALPGADAGAGDAGTDDAGADDAAADDTAADEEEPEA